MPALGRKQKIEPLSEDHLPEVAEIDRAAFGASRRGVLQRLLAQNTGYGLFEAGHLTGFALRRAAGKGHIVGPVVAADETDAIALVKRHFADLDDELVRLDAMRDNGYFIDFLAQSGLVVIETLTTMSKNLPQPAGSGAAKIFALAGPSLCWCGTIAIDAPPLAPYVRNRRFLKPKGEGINREHGAGDCYRPMPWLPPQL